MGRPAPGLRELIVGRREDLTRLLDEAAKLLGASKLIATDRFACKAVRTVRRSTGPESQRTLRISSSPSVGCVLGGLAMRFAPLL